MGDALLVGGFERLRNLFRNGQCLIQRNRAALDAVLQRHSFDNLHHNATRCAGAFDPVYLGDVRVIQRREGLRFPLESRKPVGILSEVFRE